MQPFGKNNFVARNKRRLVLWVGFGLLACVVFFFCLIAETQISDACSLSVVDASKTGTNSNMITSVFRNGMDYDVECEFAVNYTTDSTNRWGKMFASSLVRSHSSMTNTCQISESWQKWQLAAFCTPKRGQLRKLFDYHWRCYLRQTWSCAYVATPEFDRSADAGK